MKKILLITLIISMIFIMGCDNKEEISKQAKLEDKPYSEGLITTKIIDEPELTEYSNPTYEYKVKYPKNLNLIQMDRNKPSSDTVQNKIDLEIDDNSKVSIIVWNRKLFPIINLTSLSNRRPIYVDERTAQKGRAYGSAYFLETYVDNGPYSYQIEYAGNEDDSNIKIYDDIISEFEFIQPAEETIEEKMVNYEDNPLYKKEIVKISNAYEENGEMYVKIDAYFERPKKGTNCDGEELMRGASNIITCNVEMGTKKNIFQITENTNIYVYGYRSSLGTLAEISFNEFAKLHNVNSPYIKEKTFYLEMIDGNPVAVKEIFYQ